MSTTQGNIFSIAWRGLVGIASGAWSWVVESHESINSWLQTVNLFVSLLIGVAMLWGIVRAIRRGKGNTLERIRKTMERLGEKD